MKILTTSLALLVALFMSSPAVSQGGEAEPPYGLGHLEAYSLFYENYRTGDYEMALTFGEWMLEAKPREIQGHSSFRLDRQFERMRDVYAGLAEEESDPTAQRNLYDKAAGIFDLALETFTEEEIDIFVWTYRQGRFYQEHRDNIDDAMDTAYSYYERAHEMNSERFAETSDGYYARILLDHYVSQGDRDRAMALIDSIEPHAGSTLVAAIEEAREDLFSDPEERVVLLEDRLEGSDDQEAILSELAELYAQLGDRAKALETAERLYELNPNYENTMTLADIALSNAQYQQALNYLSEAAEVSPGSNERKRVYLQMSETSQNLDDLQQARNYARQALQIDSGFGEAYMRISSIYASVISSCTSGRSMERDDRTVYWLVLDYLDRAREADPSLANQVRRRIESYTPVMPSTEDKFFRGWETGDSFTIDGNLGDCYAWINEETTIR